MYPEFDLLYKNPSKTESSKQLEMSMKSLLLDEVVNGVTVDIILQKKVFALLSHPEQDVANLIWRKEILEDFRRNGSLLREFELIEKLNLKNLTVILHFLRHCKGVKDFKLTEEFKESTGEICIPFT